MFDFLPLTLSLRFPLVNCLPLQLTSPLPFTFPFTGGTNGLPYIRLLLETNEATVIIIKVHSFFVLVYFKSFLSIELAYNFVVD